MTLVMALGICFSAFAAPNPMDLSSDKVTELSTSGYNDFRYMEPATGLKPEQKPTAAFTVSINGKSQSAASGVTLDMEAPSIEMAGNQTATIADGSSPYMSSRISIWDFQYRVVPKGQDRKSLPINSRDYPYYSSWSAVQSDFQKSIDELKQAGDGAELELYLCVAESYNGEENWSDNGNSACLREGGSFPPGIIWYFASMVVDYKTGGPDFFSTPEGKTEWEESFRDPNVCAKTYEGEPGQQITFPIALRNGGEAKETTDFKAVWFGKGSDPAQGWAHPPFDFDKVELEAGESKEFTVTVTVPQPGEENRLVFGCNTDGKTPETNQENNITIIRIGNPGVDLAISIASQSIWPIPNGYSATPTAILKIWRKDSGTNTVAATWSWNIPGETGSEPMEITPGFSCNKMLYFETDTPGEYTMSTAIWPDTLTDIYPDDNTASLTLRTTKKAPVPYKPAEGSGINAGLGGN